MSCRKQPNSPSSTTVPDHNHNFKYTKLAKDHHAHFTIKSTSIQLLIPSLALCVLILLFFHFPPRLLTITNTLSTVPHPPLCPNGILPFYVYNLPPKFNLGLLQDCRHLNVYTDMCPHVANFGMGEPRSNVSWYSTHQFLAEVIFHARAENHPCRTLDPRQAKLFYVPFYGGLYASSKFRESNFTIRDQLAVDLEEFLVLQPHWQRSNGNEHFLALGRTAWDFFRPDGAEQDYGFNRLLNLQAIKNMSVLTVERNPWHGANQFGIPYTSYFHPSSKTELIKWIEPLSSLDRPYLFSFIGGKRKNIPKAAIRDNLIIQCGDSPHCRLVQCASGDAICHNPMEVLKVMMKSQFCLQAAGDSFTRRSTFDSILAGCIPVFFNEHTAYTQYEWYLPSDRESYSVFIDEDDVKLRGKSIEAELMNIPEEKVKEMRQNVIRLIPKVTYVHPNSTDDWEEDAVSVALRALSLRYLENNVVK